MTRTVIGQETITQANGETTSSAAGQIGIGPGGRLKAVSLELGGGEGPVWATVVLARGPVGMNIAKGWVRGPSVFGDSGGLVWYGDIALGEADGVAPLLQARQQNRSGANATLFVEWVIEHESRVVEDEE